jgi:hypothetical protein
MNLSVYIFGEFEGGYNQYPTDYTNDYFKEFYRRAKAPTQIAIHREGDVMYYAYIRKLEDDKYLGICAVVNGLLFKHIDKMFSVFENLFTGLVERGDLVEFNEKGSITTRVKRLYMNTEQISLLAEAIRISFEKMETVKLPPINYGRSKDSVKNFTLKDDLNEISRATSDYAYTYVYKQEGYNTETLNSYSKILGRVIEEKEALERRCVDLSSQLRKAKNEQRNMKWVSLLGFVALVLFVIIWNKVINPSEVTKYQTGEFVYYGPLNSNHKPDGIGVAIYPENDSQHRRYYVGGFKNGSRQDSIAMLLYKNGSFFYGKMVDGEWEKGTYYNIEDKSTYEGTFKDNRPSWGDHYELRKVCQYQDGEIKIIE